MTLSNGARDTSSRPSPRKETHLLPVEASIVREIDGCTLVATEVVTEHSVGDDEANSVLVAERRSAVVQQRPLEHVVLYEVKGTAGKLKQREHITYSHVLVKSAGRVHGHGHINRTHQLTFHETDITRQTLRGDETVPSSSRRRSH